MFSKEESKQIRQEFWTGFGKEYPHKWLLYNTKIRELQLKFTFNLKVALVSLDIIDDELIREYYFEKLESLKKILQTEYFPEIIFAKDYELPEGKEISRIYVELTDVSIHKEKDWPLVKEFLSGNMILLENFFKDFADFIKK